MTNSIEDSNCKYKIECGFYDKDFYDKQEMLFYIDYCLKGGIGCGIKRHKDLTSKLK